MKPAALLLAVLVWGFTHPAHRWHRALTERSAAANPGSDPARRVTRAHALRSVSARFLVTSYCLHGTTATGTEAGPGTVAVDPSVVPLGSRMTVAGYGAGRAADTGGAIRNYHIDVWYASCAQAFRWGVRWRTVSWETT